MVEQVRYVPASVETWNRVADTSLTHEIACATSLLYISSDASVAEVGPGEMPFTQKRSTCYPMSPWPYVLPNRLSARGSYTFFDLPSDDDRGGYHDIQSMVRSMESVFAFNQTAWRNITVVEGDFMHHSPSQQFDVLVDHGTLAEWILLQGKEIDWEEWIARVGDVYKSSIYPDGKLILSYQPKRHIYADMAIGDLLLFWRSEGLSVAEFDVEDVWKLPKEEALTLHECGVPVDLGQNTLTPHYPHTKYIVVEKQ